MEHNDDLDQAAMLEELLEERMPNGLSHPPLSPAKPKTKGKKESNKFSMWSWLEAVIDYNTALLFSDTGGGKTKTCQQIAYDCAIEGKKVKYIDHEANFSQSDKNKLIGAGVIYRLIPDWRKLYEIKKDDIDGFDLVIIDSTTLAITGKWASLDLHNKGVILQQLQGMVYRLSQECISKRKTIVLMTAQPISVMGDRRALAPLGDKMHFMCKEIYHIYAPRDEETGNITKRIIRSYRSRNFQDGTIISAIITKKFGVEFDKKHMTDLLSEL